LYSYTFIKPGNAGGFWWDRKRIAIWIPAMAADDLTLTNYLKSNGYKRD